MHRLRRQKKINKKTSPETVLKFIVHMRKAKSFREVETTKEVTTKCFLIVVNVDSEDKLMKTHKFG